MAFGASDEIVAATFVARDEVTPVVQKMRTGISGFAGDVKKGIGVAFGFSTVGLIKGAADAVTGFIGDSIDAYKQQQVATAQLTAALDANVPAWRSQQGAIDAAAKAAINLGFQDDDLALGLSHVVAATHDVQKGLEVMAVAEDLARFKHISLTDAADALVKVEAGQYRGLKTLGIQLRTNATQEEALAAVRKVTAGQAIAYTETLSGKQEVLSAKLNEQQEILGEKLAPAQLAVNQAQIDGVTAAGNLFAVLEMGGKPVQDQVKATRDWFDSVKTFVPMLGFLTDAVDKSTEAYVQSADQTDELARHLNIVLPDAIDHTAEHLVQGAPAIRAAADRMWAGINSELDLAKAESLRESANLPGDIGDAIKSNKQDVNSGMKDLMDLIIHPLKRQKEIARVEGALTSAELAAGLGSNDPLIRGAALALQKQLQDRWSLLTGQAYRAGTAVGNAFVDAYRNQLNHLPYQNLLQNIAGGHMGGGGGRAAGGPVSAGQTYLVGERGPELLTMGQPGYVSPNGSSSHGHDIYMDGRLVGRAIDERMGRDLATSNSYNWTRG